MSFINHLIKLNLSVSRIKAHVWRVFSFFLIALVAALGTYTIVRAAPAIFVTMADAFIGGDGDGKADPGETIEYTAVIQNSGADPATGVTFNDIIDLNTTLVAGSLNVSPLAVDDSYDTIGNTLLEVGVTASGNPVVLVNGGLFDNDTEFLSDTFTLKSVEADTTTPFTTATETAGGSVTVQADGTFSYTPPVGFSGADHFDYVITDDGPDNILGNADDLTGAGRVTINVTTQRVWYVKNDATAGGLGRSNDPFDTLTEAQTASAANDTIYVFTGSGTTGQSTGITLKANQRFVGEGVQLDVPVSVNGGLNPTVLRAAGSAPSITNTGGNGVTVTDISGVSIRGFNVAGNTNAVAATFAVASGSVTISNNIISGGSANAIDVTTTTTTVGGGSATINNNTISAAGAEGIDINGSGTGTLAVDIHDNTVTSTGNGIDIQRTAGSVNIVAFDDNAVSGNTGGIGINIVGTGATILFDTNPGTAAFDVVSGGTTSIGQSGNGVGAAGLVLDNVRGDLSFSDLDIYATGNALFVDGTTSNYTGTSGTRITANTNTPTLDATGGAAASFSQVNINLVLNSLTSTNSTGSGVSLAETSGTFTVPSGSSITNATGTDFSVNASGGSQATSNVAITYGGTITDDLGTLVQIQNVTASSTHIFTGAITDNNDGDGSGISLTGNSGATITFSGGMLLSTSANPAFTATGGGTINVCDENPCNPAATGALANTLTTTTGTALNVANTTIGANNLEFRSISANGGTNGIILNTTGTSGGLKVKGNGGTCTDGNTGGCSGGIIQNMTGGDDSSATPVGTGIVLNNTFSVSLTRMYIHDHSNYGIRGTGVIGFTLDTSVVSGVNGTNVSSPFSDGSLSFDNLSGTSAITNSSVSGGYQRNIRVDNTTGTLILTVNSNSIHNTGNTAGDDGILIEVGGGTATLNVTNNTFAAHGGDHFNLSLLNSPTVDLNFTGNLWSGGHAIGLGQGLFILGAAFNGTFTYDILNNGTVGSPLVGNNSGGAIHVNKGSGTGTFSGTISNNVIGDPAVNSSGSLNAAGIDVEAHGAGGSHTTLITNNLVRQFHNNGINIVAGEGNAAFNVTMTGNTVSNPDASIASFHGVEFNIGTLPTDALAACLDVRNNTLTNGANEPNGGVDLRMRQRQLTTVRLPGYGGANNDNAAVQTFLTVTNSNALTTILAGNTVAGGGGGFIGGAACAQPIAMTPGNQLAANAQPSVNDSVPQGAQVLTIINDTASISTDLKAVNAFATASSSVKFSKQGSGINSHNAVVNASINSGGKPLFLVSQPAPAQSGETVNVPAFTLPAGKTVTIKFRVTVDTPIDNPVGASKILNQGTVSGSNFGNVLTTDAGPADCVGSGTETCTPVDRPDTTVVSLNRVSGNPRNAATATWQIVFADPVDGLLLIPSNFALVQGGSGPVSGASITGVSAVSGPPSTTWNITASTGTGDGTLGLNMVNDTGLSHDVFIPPGSPNPLPFIGQVYTIDKTAPTTVSFTRGTPATSPTNADTLIFRVTFSEDVSLVDTTDFAVDGTTTATGTSVNPISGSIYDVTVSGGDLANYNGVVGLNFNSGTLDITDLADNALASTEPTTDQTYTVDNAAPTVTINQAVGQADPTNASPINFTVIFSESVTDFDDAADVDLSAGTAPGVLSAVISGGPTTYNVAVSGMTGNGTVIASIPAGAATDAIANLSTASTNTDNTVAYDNTIPTVTINQAVGQADPTGSSPINFTVVFSEAVSDFDDAADVTLTGTAAATTINITGGPTTYNVAVSGMAGIGTVIADIPAGAATDSASNLSAVSISTDKTVTYDNTSPTVTINQAVGQADPTGTSPINFTVVFSEAVSGFATGDVDLSASTTSGTLIGTVSGGPTTYNVAVSGMTGDGTIIASIPAGAAQDASTNGNDASTSTDNSVLFDTVAPSVTINQAVGQVDPTGASPINFTVIFTEAVTDFDDGADVTLTGTAGATTSVITGGPTTYNVAVSGMAGNGTVIASIPAGVAFVLALQPHSVGTFTDHTVTYDSAVPTVTINQKTSAPAQADPTNTSPINFTVVFTEAVTDFDDVADVTLTGTAGATTSVITGGPTTYNVAVSGMTGDGTVIVNIPAGAATDTANLSVASTSTDNTVTYDATAPDTIIDAPTPANPTNSTIANFTFHGNDGTGVGGLTFDCKLDTSAYLACNGGSISYFGMSDGTHTFYARATDSLGNTDATPATYNWTVDTTIPTVLLSSLTTDPTNVSPILVTITFSESVDIGTGIGDLSITNGSASTPVGSGTTYTFNLTPSGQGPVTAVYLAGSAVDAANNPNTVSPIFSRTYDTVGPTVTINQAAGQADPASNSTVSPINFTVVFSESVTGFTGTDVNLSGTATPTTAIVTEIAPMDGTTYNVAVSGMNADGTVIATILAGGAMDTATNSNAASTSTDNTVTNIFDAPPVITEGPSVNVTMSDDGSPTPFALTLHATDANSDPLTWSILSPANNGLASVAAGPGLLSVASYTPTTNYNGSDSFVVQVSDGANTDSISVNVTIEDTTPPTVLSSLRADPNPTSAVNVNFTVTFSEPVTGVNAADFSLTTSGGSGAAVSGVSGSGSAYTVTVSTGTGNGTIRLDVVDDDTILDAALIPLGTGFTSGQSYTINKSPIFDDVPYSYWANSFIERLYNAGITGGCGINPLIYCPDTEVTRAQMAVFLLRSLHGPSYLPPIATGTVFGDVPVTYWAAAWIEQLSLEGVTGGCGNGNYCPEQISTTRAQMAVFLLRGIYGSDYIPPAATGVFNDVPTDYWAAAWIEQLAAEGITSGCGGGNYCPESSLTRAEMAVFLVRAFNLP